MSDFTITTTANFDTDTLKSDVVTITDQYVTADQIQLSFPYSDKDADLVSYWRMNVNSATQIDETGTNEGTVTGATYTASGKFGGGYSFDGTGDYITVPNDASLNTANLSLSVWFYAESDDLSVQNRIITKPYTSAAEPYYQYTITAYNTVTYPKTIFFQMNARGTRYVVTAKNSGWDYGVWNHVVCTYDGKTMKVYVNGAFQEENIDPRGNITSYATALGIGKYPFSAGNDWNGKLDEVKIYNDALNQTEITALYNSSNQYKATGNWRSASQTMTASHKLKDITITHSGLDADTFIDKIEILDASDNSLISTYGTNITSGASTNLVTGDFDGTGFADTEDTNFKIKVYFDGNAGTTTPVITQIEGNYESTAAVITYNLNFSKTMRLE